MLRITGYSDKYSAFPGEKVKFYVNAEKNENYDVQIVRLIHGDTNLKAQDIKKKKLEHSVTKHIKEETKESMVDLMWLFLKTID